MKEMLTNVARLLHLLKTLAMHGFAWWLHRGSDDGPERARRLLEAMGGSFVKLGQMLALQPDILPPAYCSALQDLLDRVPAFPFEQALKLIHQETGRKAEEIFDSIDPEPLATASVAQVHVAWIGGRKVAVKVQRPNAEHEFSSDIRLVESLVSWIRRLKLRWLYWLLEPLGEFIAWTGEELDFRCEARYAEQLASLSEGSGPTRSGHPMQKVPRPWGGLVTRRLLVIDFLEGPALLDYLRALESDAERAKSLEPADFDPELFAANIIDNFLRDAFENGIYHADLHPANLLMLENSVVGYVDFGITGILSRAGRRQLMAMTLALAKGDMDLFHRCFSELTAPDSRASPKGFRRGLDRLATSWYEPDSGKLRVNFTRIMVDMLALSRQNHFLPERDIVKYIRSSIAIDGLITRFAPDFDVGAYLAQRCAVYFGAERRREQLAMPRMLDWVEASGRLMVDGPERFLKWARRLEQEGEIGMALAHPEVGSERALILSVAILLVAAVAIIWPPDVATPGMNLWSAQMLFLVASSLFLCFGAWRRSGADEVAEG